MLKFRCTTCEQKIGVPDDWANHLVRCPRCRSAIPVPKVVEVEVKRVPVFAEPAKSAPSNPSGSTGKKPEPATQRRTAPVAKRPAQRPVRKKPTATPPPPADPVITKASVPTDGAIFAKPPVNEAVGNGALPAPADQAPARSPAAPREARDDASDKKAMPDRPMVEQLRWVVEPGITSKTAADLLKDLGSDGNGEPAEPPPTRKNKFVEPRPPRRRQPVNYGGWALAVIGFLAGAGALALIVLPAWTKFSLPAAIFGAMMAVLATVGRASRRGGEAVLAVAAFVVCGLGAVMALALSGGVIPPGSTARAMAQSSKPVLAERKGNVEVRVTKIGVVHPLVYADGQWKTLQTTPQRCLQIDLELREMGNAGKVAYRSWGRFQDGADPPALMDNEGNPLKLLDFTPLVPPGRPRQSPAYMDGARALSDVLLFEVPPAAAETLDLQLPGANFGADGIVEFHIPSAMLRR